MTSIQKVSVRRFHSLACKPHIYKCNGRWKVVLCDLFAQRNDMALQWCKLHNLTKGANK